MESKRLSKHRTLVLQLLCGGIFSAVLGLGLASLYASSSNAAPDTTPGTAAPAAAAAAGVPSDHQFDYCVANPTNPNCPRQPDVCQPLVDKIDSFAETLGQACGNTSIDECNDKLDACTSADDSVTDETRDKVAGSTNCSSLKDLNVNCKQVNGGNSRDYTQAKTDAHKTLQDTQKQLMEAQKAQQTAANATKQKIAELQADIQNQTVMLEATQKKTATELADYLNKEDAAKAKAVTDAAAKLAELDNQQLALNTERNVAVEAIAKANDDKLSKCRDYAEIAYNKDLEALKIKIQARDSIIKNLGSGTRISSYTHDKAKADQTAEAQSYSGHYTNCLNGVEGGGQAATNAIKQAQDALGILIAQQKDKITAIAAQRALVNKSLNDNTTTMTNDEKIARQKATDALDLAQKTTTLKIAKDNADIVTATQELAQSQRTNAEELQMIQQNIATASADLQNAELRSSCFNTYGVSESRAKKAEDNWGKMPAARSGLQSYCSSMKVKKCDATTIPDSCTKFASPAARSRTPSPASTGVAR